MRLATSFTLLVLPFAVHAGYYSEGWSPDATTTATISKPTSSQVNDQKPPAFPSLSSFDWTSLISSGPIASLFNRVGVNVTEHLEAAKQRAAELPWDSRVPLIADDTYEWMIEYELLTPQEAEERTWFIVVTTGSTRDPLSKFVDEQFDKTYELAVQNGDIPHVKFGRIDYMSVTKLTSRWLIWKAPMLVVLHNRGQTLRFLRPNEIRMEPENLYRFLKLSAWTEVPEWDGPFAPGGDLEKWVEFYAEWQTKIYNWIGTIPKWIFLVASGTIGSFVIQYMHSRDPKPAPQQKRFVVKPSTEVPPPPVVKEEPVKTTTSTTKASSTSAARGSPSTRKRKSGRK